MTPAGSVVPFPQRPGNERGRGKGGEPATVVVLPVPYRRHPPLSVACMNAAWQAWFNAMLDLLGPPENL